MSLRIVCVFLLLNFWSFSAQEFDPDIVNTWYLISHEGDVGPIFYIDNIEPPINPSLTINADLSFTGTGACNTFTGQFVDDGIPEYLRLVSFETTTLTCDEEAHNDFESLFFGSLGIVNNLYYYQVFISDPFFSLEPFPGFVWSFQLEPLSVSDSRLNKINIYPNPTADSFKISGITPAATKISITSLNGITQSLEGSPAQGYSVAHLQAGVYIVTIQSENTRQNLRLVKL